ncbi:hypothetical protein E2C01_091141 [Portunus trituberculatus]|uniref:Uncharacterized protein n=1 Tax=Portunus trituberculatus TaxID=210409 RepID=A0A5B7JID8_PORTR|nr:hypothetical protein [Portunus trituberculatus]
MKRGKIWYAIETCDKKTDIANINDPGNITLATTNPHHYFAPSLTFWKVSDTPSPVLADTT